MINAYAAHEPGGPLTPFQYDPGPLGVDEVEIAVEFCGLCHSDLSMLNNEWRLTRYPFVPGHEVVGKVAAKGDSVTHLELGDRVGLGWNSGYCNTCADCLGGDQNLCRDAKSTIVGRHGGFADTVRAQAVSVVRLPDGMSSEVAGPLFCGGITVYAPLEQFDVPPTARVGVIGIGGLGHMALQFANAWGCEVTAFTSSESKREEALALGAHSTLDSRDPDALKGAKRRFDLLLSTVNVPLDWGAYVNTLAPKGRLHFLGAVTEPVALSVFPLMAGQRSVSSSPVGSPGAIARMLAFAARHDIAPKVEMFSLRDANDAVARLEHGSPRYRVVLDAR